EQVFKFEGAIGCAGPVDFEGTVGLRPGGEADHGAVLLGDVRAPFGQSLRAEDQVLRMRQQVVTVALVGQRRAAVDTSRGGQVSRLPQPDHGHSLRHARSSQLRVIHGRSLSGLRMTQIRLIRPPATSNANTEMTRPSSWATRPGWPLTVRSRNTMVAGARR